MYVGRRRWGRGRWRKRPGDGPGRALSVGGWVPSAAWAAARAAGSVPTGPCGSCSGPGRTVSRCATRICRSDDSRQRGWLQGYCRRRGSGAEAPGPGSQAEASNFVGKPDAECPPTTATGIAVAAKDPPGPQRLSLGTALVIAVQKAVPNQRADHLAVRAGGPLEAFRNREPFRKTVVEPSLLSHSSLHENRDSTDLEEARGSGGVRYNPSSGVRVKTPGPGGSREGMRCQILDVINIRR